jgi:hypothetical protein
MPASDTHEVTISIRLSIHAASDLKAQDIAIDLIESVSYQILQHPAVHNIAVPVSPTNPCTEA